MTITELETQRLKLRQWKPSDLPDFAKLNADPAVMEYFPSTLSETDSNAIAEKCRSLIIERGWSFWAVEEKSSNQFIGFVGLHTPKDSLPCAPCVEIGWRLSKRFWNRGYASEAAQSALAFAFEALRLEEVVSFTTVSNQRSKNVMKRIGMTNSHKNFHHPDLPDTHPLAEHVLYTITREQWQANRLS